jgi:hypothetical protein
LTKVYDYYVKWDTLYVTVKEGDKEEEFDPLDSDEADLKYPDQEDICNEDDIGYEEEEEDEESDEE